jgi:EAL domain-containing protein (putative c-di-GMP-specific phosphodiesterase class I)
MQGYHFARPVPAALITERLDAQIQASMA